MQFNSLHFVFFFPIVFLCYFSLPKKWRASFLLLSSVYFYAVFIPSYLLILFGLIFCDYWLVQLIEKNERAKRKFFFVLSLCANLGTLFFFKYFNFFGENLSAIADFFGWNYSISLLKIALPLGLSFHIFQNISYVIEVYKRKFKAEKNFITYALYVMFFPQLVAGPIERPEHLLPQLKNLPEFSYFNTISGLKLMLWGFAKKVIVADRLAVLVNYVYGNSAILPGPAILIAMIAFAFELYADFSGYSDIARGSARVFGINLVKNFDAPYSAKSIPEFWRRWHMSLSNWCRDYIYFPIVYSLRAFSPWNTYIAIFITFIAVGLWHGAGWNYILMGVLFAVYISLSNVSTKIRNAYRIFIPKNILSGYSVLSTFSLVIIAWVFFRSETLGQAGQIIRALVSGWNKMFNFSYLYSSLFTEAFLGLRKWEILIAFMSVLLMLVFESSKYNERIISMYKKKRTFVRWSIIYIFIALIFQFGYFGEQTFIYFQF